MTDKNNTGEIKVTEYIEHKDGSATIIFDADVKARDLLVSVGLKHLLEKAVNGEDGYGIQDPNQLELDI